MSIQVSTTRVILINLTWTFALLCLLHVSAFADESDNALSNIFEDNLEAFQPQDDDESGLKKLLRSIKDSFETCDKTLLIPVLSESYKHVIHESESSVVTIPKIDYIYDPFPDFSKKRCKKLERTLNMAEIRIVPEKTRANEKNMTLLTTYRSNYFSPRFLEAYRFTKTNRDWLIDRRTTIPLYPKQQESYEVQIYIGKLSEFENQENSSRLLLEDADLFLATALSKTYKKIPVDKKQKAVYVVFKEPPIPGTNILVRHRYYDKRNRQTSSYSDRITVDSVNPWFFRVSSTTITSRGSVRYEVLVDGKKLYKRKVKTY